MIAATSVVELAGPRLALYRPPKGTASRILNIRLLQQQQQQQRCFHRPKQTTSCHPLFPNLLHHNDNAAFAHALNARHEYSTATACNEDITEAEAYFLQKLVRRYGSYAPWENANPTKASIEANAGLCSRLSQNGKPDDSVTVGGPAGSLLADPDGLAENLPGPFIKALDALQQRDSRKLLIYLKQIAAMPMEELIEAVAVLPRTTFSEFLRALDPTNTGPDNDPTHGAQIQVGMWKRLNMEHAIDDWGTRKLYIRLLQRMLRLMVALQKSGQQLNINDYMPLIRAAGATSDMEGAKLLWKQMQWTGTNHWRQSDAYNEFIKARFLVEPLYYGFDKTRTMVQPRNLHRMGHVKFPWYTIKKLDRLRFNTRLLGHRFGLNKTVSHAQDVSRALRKRKPITRVFQHILLHGHDINEKLLCSAMIAFGRAGSLRFIRTRILEDWFNISVYKHKTTGVVQVGPATRKTMALKDFTRPVRPRIRPTEQLLHAMVQTYCGNGQLAMAFQLLDYVSKAYNIPITPKIWFELLEWTYVMSVPPISSAWMIAGLRDRVPDKSATEMIWNTMTAAYNVKPGFDQYHFLISSLNHRGQYSSMIEHMRAARRFYDDKCAEHEAAILEYIRALRDGLHGIALTTVFRAYQRTRFEKQHMRYRMSLWCRRFLQKKFRTLNLNDEFAVRHIPDFVREFREFVENPVLYRTATGYVQLLDPVHEFEHRVYVRSLDLDIPMRGRGGREGKWHLKRVRRRHFAILSSHSLADRKTHKLNPLSLLLGELDSFRTPQLPEYRGKKELKANEIPLRMPRTNKGAREVSPTAPNFKPRRTRQ